MNASDFDVAVSTSGKTATIRVSGEIDLATFPRFEQGVDVALASGLAEIVIDLSHCTFLDSTGLGVLMRSKRAAETDGRTVRVEGAQGIVRRVLDAAAFEWE